MMEKCSAVLLDGIKLSPPVRAEYDHFFNMEKAGHLARRRDYARWQYVLDRLAEGSSLLDVGVGAGQLIRAAQRSRRFRKVEGLDIKKHSKFFNLPDDPVKMTYADAADMPFEPKSFDYVLALEMIEHLPTDAMSKVVTELRRVAAKAVVISVPYCEKQPLPRYHKQRFTFSRLRRLFPTANITLCVEKRMVPWVCVEELQGEGAQRTGSGQE